MPNKLTLTLSRSGHHELIILWKKKNRTSDEGVKTQQKSSQITITSEKSKSNIQSQLRKYRQWHTFLHITIIIIVNSIS